ncbi:hypothetical protein UF75_1481 [Desulfosporosinus sp. I2]|nr:hypothetical protein UF75_1481 [Desulfosporosinus sp. I2]
MDPENPEVWNYGFTRIVTFWQSPPLGASILGITFFFLIAFFSNALLESVNPVNLGITVTIGTLGLLSLVTIILFLL